MELCRYGMTQRSYQHIIYIYIELFLDKSCNLVFHRRVFDCIYQDQCGFFERLVCHIENVSRYYHTAYTIHVRYTKIASQNTAKSDKGSTTIFDRVLGV